MARLNEAPASADSLETLRKKLLRQNRDLAKLNNIRALRIRELENDCACMLSENVGLRARIAELEQQVENNETRRIADHAMVIKEKLESQLTEWGTLIAGLGLEPPPKRHSPQIMKRARRRTSYDFTRTSPSQRRLRDVAKDIEELGHISEHKSYSRRSMNPEQILALRKEEQSTASSNLDPLPEPEFLEDDVVTTESPSPERHEPSPKPIVEPPEMLPSPTADSAIPPSPSPTKRTRDANTRPADETAQFEEPRPEEPQPKVIAPDASPAVAPKTGIKRKLASREDFVTAANARSAQENQPARVMTGKGSIRDKTGGKTLKELTTMRKEERPVPRLGRKPLSSKSTNDDIASPKKKSRQRPGDDIGKAKATLSKPKLAQDRPKTKPKSTIIVDSTPEPEGAPPVATVTSDLGTPLAEPDLLAPNSPISAPPADAARGDTPPPADISSNGETSRGSRRSRGVVSYAEPNLRDKMRRPTKDMVDAVTGARRSSQFELIAHDSAKVKRESSSSASSATKPSAPEPGSIPASPLAGKGDSDELPNSVATHRPRRPSAVTKESINYEEETSRDESTESIPTDSDLYDFKTSPQIEKQSKRRSTSRQMKSARRFSAALENDDPYSPEPRPASRRRSMMV